MMVDQKIFRLFFSLVMIAAGTIVPAFSEHQADAAPAGVGANTKAATTVVRLVAEAGFVGVVDHRIRFAREDSSFAYHDDGGQDVLFPFTRLSVELTIADRHTVVFLYQPLELETRVKMPAGLSIGGKPFTGESLRLLYSFPFYRLSYLNRFLRGEDWWVEAGGSLQIRNANTEFEALGPDSAGDPAKGFYRSAGTGPVPLLKLRAHYDLPGGFWLGTEIDGIYAPVSYLNGSENATVGALLDASLRTGYRVTPGIDVFLNLRYLGGGAANEDPSDYAVNWLNTGSVTIGAVLTLKE